MSDRSRRTVASHVSKLIIVIVGVLIALSACMPTRRVGTTPRSGAAEQDPAAVRVLSWNVAEDAFDRRPATFRALVGYARPDILLLDEVAPSVTGHRIRAQLEASAGGEPWQVAIGASGGRQRGVIASRWPLEPVPELSRAVPYPAHERDRLQERMVAAGEDRPAYTMEGGIPVNGALVSVEGRRLLVVTLDLQCCGNDPGSWQEARRRVEAGEIRARIARFLDRTRVDGVVLGGDFNLVGTALPLVVLSGPYPAPNAGLIGADLRHLDGTETWTWDGRGTPFPSRAMDFVMYSPQALELRDGYVLDTEDLPSGELRRLGLVPESTRQLSDHRPVVAHFVWR
jgi:hypothetical protein